jgi:Lar family restriction alleviation protein
MKHDDKDRELKPCPFCGCYGIKMDSDPTNPKRHTIKCEDCPGRAEFFSSDREQAIAAWNRRATVSTAPSEAEIRNRALEEAAKVCVDYINGTATQLRSSGLDDGYHAAAARNIELAIRALQTAAPQDKESGK